MSKGPYSIDCLKLALEAERTLLTGQVGHMLGTGYPLTVIIGAAFVFIFKFFGIPDPVLAVNFMSVVTSSLAVLSFYFLVRELFDQTAAIFASIMLSLCPIFFGISVYGKSQSLNMLLLITGIYFLFVYKKRRVISALILSGIFLGGSGANRTHEIVLLFVPLSYLLFLPFPGIEKETSNKKRLEWKAFFTFWFLVGMIVILCHLPYLIQDNRGAYLKQISNWFDCGFRGKFILGFSSRIWTGAGYLVKSLTWTGIAVSLGGMVLLARTNKRVLLFIALWILFPYVFYSNSIMSVTSRYFAVILPPILLAQGYMFSCMVNKHKVLKFAAVVLFLIIVNVLWYRIYPPLKIRHDHAYLPEYARWLSRKTQPGARVIASDESLFIKYYGGISPLGRPLRARRISENELNQFRKKVDALLGDKVPVYIHSVSLFSYDPGGHFARFMKKNYDLAWVGQAQYEDWHRGGMVSDIFPNHLYQVQKK